jgi:hypothetical protein
MLARFRTRLTYANVMATIAVFVALGGTSYAVATGSIDSREIKDNTVRSKDIRNNQVRTQDVRNNHLRGRDIRNNTLTGGDIDEGSLDTVANATTAANASNATNSGQLGGKTASAFLQFNGAIPSGTTVIGNWSASPSGDGAGAVGFDEIDLPGVAPANIDSGAANMGAGTTNGGDNDAACTGNAKNPTAPAGKMCFYVGFQVGLSDLSGFISEGPDNRGAAIRVTGTGGSGGEYARGAWAYTAP